MRTDWPTGEGRISGFVVVANPLDSLCFPRDGPGQSCSQRKPHLTTDTERSADDSLGVPLGIRQVAAMLGVSPWTVRQQYLPCGLPHLRSGPHGKLIFFRNQIVAWILRRQQQKGG